jgi:hypothetical protein
MHPHRPRHCASHPPMASSTTPREAAWVSNLVRIVRQEDVAGTGWPADAAGTGCQAAPSMTRSRTADQGEGRVAPLGVVATTLRSRDVSGPSGCEVPIFTVVLPAPSSTSLDTSARTPMSLERTWTSLDGRQTVPMHATPSLGGCRPPAT